VDEATIGSGKCDELTMIREWGIGSGEQIKLVILAYCQKVKVTNFLQERLNAVCWGWGSNSRRAVNVKD